MSETERTYDAIAAAYDERRAPQLAGWLAELFEALLAAAPLAGPFADLGCGPGYEVGLARARGRRALGLDLSAGMLAQARRRVGPLLVRGDLRALPFRSSSLAAIWSAYALLHLPRQDVPLAVAEVARVLVPGGAAALVYAGGGGYRREEVAYAPDLYRHFTYLDPREVDAGVMGAGLRVQERGRPPGARRAAGWVLARRPVE